ncbi:MAG: Rid family hydrolase [Gammaproteobacteria bacterium]
MPTVALSSAAPSSNLLRALCGCLTLALFHISEVSAAPAFSASTEEGRPYSVTTLSRSGLPIYFTSGSTAGADSTATDMKGQATATLDGLVKNLTTAGLSLEDVAFVRAYLAPGPDGKIDYAGWESAWTDRFGKTAVKPARTTVGVPLLGKPETLIEVEFVTFPALSAGQFASSAKQGLPVTSKVLKPYGTRESRILTGMGVLPGTALYWTQGSTAPVLDAKLEPTDRGHRGDMNTQARNALLGLQKNLANVGPLVQGRGLPARLPRARFAYGRQVRLRRLECRVRGVLQQRHESGQARAHHGHDTFVRQPEHADRDRDRRGFPCRTLDVHGGRPEA